MVNLRQMTLDRERLQQDAGYRHKVWGALYTEYRDDIYRYCVSRLGQAQGEEIMQEVFIAAWQALPNFKGKADIKSWVISIARNKCQQTTRNDGRHEAIQTRYRENIVHMLHANSAGTPEETEPKNEREALLQKAIGKLDKDQHLLWSLRYTTGLSTKQIADSYRLSVSAIEKRLNRICKYLEREVGAL